MGENEKLLKVVDVTIDIKSDFISYVRFWVDELRFFPYGFEGDRIYAWNDDKIPYNQKDFHKAYDIVNQSEILNYHISSFQICRIEDDIDAGYILENYQNEQNIAFVDETSIETVIELWYYLGASKPLLISETLLCTEENLVRKQFPGLEIWQLEELSEALIEDIRCRKMALESPEESQDKEKSSVSKKYSMDEVNSYSEKKCNRYLRLLLKQEDYETAIVLREVMKERNFNIAIDGPTNVGYETTYSSLRSGLFFYPNSFTKLLILTQYASAG